MAKYADQKDKYVTDATPKKDRSRARNSNGRYTKSSTGLSIRAARQLYWEDDLDLQDESDIALTIDMYDTDDLER